MNDSTSHQPPWPFRTRLRFALVWAAIITVSGCIDFFITDKPWRMLLFRQTFMFVLTFTVCALIVWPIMRLQGRAKICIWAFVSSGLALVVGAGFTWTALRLLREDDIRFVTDSRVVIFSRADDPWLFWLFPGTFAALALVSLIFAIRTLTRSWKNLRDQNHS